MKTISADRGRSVSGKPSGSSRFALPITTDVRPRSSLLAQTNAPRSSEMHAVRAIGVSIGKPANKTLCAVRRWGAPRIEPWSMTHQPRSALIICIRVHRRSNVPAQPNLPARRRCRSGNWTVDPEIREQDLMRRERTERVGTNAIAVDRKDVAPSVSERLPPMDADEDDQRGSRSIGQRQTVGRYAVQPGMTPAWPEPRTRTAGDRTRSNDPSTAIRADRLHPRPSALKPFATTPYPRAASIPAQHWRWHRAGDRLDIRKYGNNTPCAVRNGSPTRIAPLRPTRGYSPVARRPPSWHHSQICRPIPEPFARPASIAVENILRRAHTDPIIQGLGATRFVGR